MIVRTGFCGILYGSKRNPQALRNMFTEYLWAGGLSLSLQLSFQVSILIPRCRLQSVCKHCRPVWADCRDPELVEFPPKRTFRATQGLPSTSQCLPHCPALPCPALGCPPCCLEGRNAFWHEFGPKPKDPRRTSFLETGFHSSSP